MRELLTFDDLQDCLALSEQRPIFIFKHSTRCPISSMAFEEVEAYERVAEQDAPEVFLIKVIETRPLSNAVAQKLDVEHQSPQIILVHDHVSLWSTSHYNITKEKMLESLKLLGQVSRQAE